MSPFSHTPGITFLLPQSALICKVFPNRVLIFDNGTQIGEVNFTFGPLEKFTVVQDLEKNHIQVTGFSKSGFIRYQIYAGIEPKSWGIRSLKGMSLPTPIPVSKTHFERLHLGCFKQLKWPELRNRCDLKELLPLWYTLSQKTTVPACSRTSNSLLGAFQLKDLFQAGFDIGFVPRVFDTDYQGFSLPVVEDTTINPLALLAACRDPIRELFFLETNEAMSFLPKLPPEFHCGSFAQAITSKGHEFSMEWSKHLIRTLSFTPLFDEKITFSFQKEIKKFRLRQNKRDRGTYYDNYSTLSLENGNGYLIDCFKK